MNTRLNHIQNWNELAEQTKWSVSALAEKCDASVRTLERHFHEKFGKCPRGWIGELQQQRALEHLRGGLNVNETASKMGYGHTSSFCRKFPGLREKAMKTAESSAAQANMSQTPNSFHLQAGSRCSNLRSL
jgi:AraC-like DNA-binding protein